VKAAIGAAGIEPGKAASLMGQVFSDALNLSLGTLESTVMTLAKAINEWLVAQGKTPLDTSGSFVTASGPSAYGMTPAQTASWVAGTLSYGDAQAISSKTHIAIPMASGGMGRVTRPTNFLAGEAGAEDYLFSGGGKSFADIFSGGGGGDTYVLEATIPVLVDGKQVAVTTQTQLLRKKGRGAKLALA